MYSYIFAGCILYISFILVRILIIVIIALYCKDPVREHLIWQPKQVILEGLLFSLFFAGTLWLTKDYPISSGIQILISIFMVALIPSYHYILTPLKYLFLANRYCKHKSLTQFLKEEGYPYNVYVIEGNVTNAYATGVLPFSKTILIGEHLLKNMPPEEVKSILLHEVGHLRHNHLFKLYFLNLILVIASFMLFFIQQKVSFIVQIAIPELLMIAMTGAIIGLLFWYFLGKAQHYFEYQADQYAAKHGGAKCMIRALRTLDILSKGDVSKGGITHPPLTKRIHFIKTQNEK